ncbi:MAG: sphingosine kinase [Myxococcota bacterium]|nr:sphingosine kinase [Myxococcota bacterium]
MAGIGVVLNPNSGHNLRNPRAASRLARALGDHGVLRQARSIDELYRIAEDFRRDGIDVLAISGGDGTNHVTLTGFIDVYGGATIPQVALLRGGTMNTVANSVGVERGKPEGLLGRLVRAYAVRASGASVSASVAPPLPGRVSRRTSLRGDDRPVWDVVERHVMRIAAPGERRAQYGFLFGTGVVHGFLAEYYRDGATPLVALKTLMRGIGSAAIGGETIRRMARPFRGSVAFEGGEPWPNRDYLAVAAGTIGHIGLNFKPFHRCLEGPGQFHMLGIHTSALSFIGELPRIHRGEPMRGGKAYDALAGRAVLSSREGPIRYMIDGDLHETDGDLEMTIGTRVRLVVLA